MQRWRRCTISLQKLQDQLSGLYELEVAHAIEDFLITCPELARRLDSGPRARELPEKLLISECSDDLEIALYLDAHIVRQLEQHDPTESLHAGNIVEFWTALEGISHFLYAVWNASFDRAFTLFELELQAEIDKFILAAFLIGRQQSGRMPDFLYPQLFGKPIFDSRLSHSEGQRYRVANDLASRYCRHLQEQFLGRLPGNRLVRELRRFYRLSHRDKIQHIAMRC